MRKSCDKVVECRANEATDTEYNVYFSFFINPTLLYRGISFIVAFAHLVNIVVLFANNLSLLGCLSGFSIF